MKIKSILISIYVCVAAIVFSSKCHAQQIDTIVLKGADVVDVPFSCADPYIEVMVLKLNDSAAGNIIIYDSAICTINLAFEIVMDLGIGVVAFQQDDLYDSITLQTKIYSSTSIKTGGSFNTQNSEDYLIYDLSGKRILHGAEIPNRVYIYRYTEGYSKKKVFLSTSFR